MSGDARSTFLTAYGQVLTKTWSDEAYAKQVGSNPAAALSAAGFNVPSGVNVNVEWKIPNTASGKPGTIADLIGNWEKGIASGNATLYLPAKPSLVESELSDEQLSAVAGGACSSSIISCCCCC